MQRYEVIVVGAGPAGAAASRALAQAGCHVLLLEREALPRYKPCGGGLGPKAVARLPFPVNFLPHVQVKRIAFRLRGGSPVTWDLPVDFPFHMVMRADLDHQLALAAERAGAQLREREAAKDIYWSGGGFTVVTQQGGYRAPFVIAADGPASLVRRALGGGVRGQVGVALECEVEASASTMAAYRATALFDVEAAPEGYGWIFPKRSHLSVGLGSMRPGRVSLPGLLRRFVVKYGLLPPAAAENVRIYAHALPLATPGEPARLGNALLAGDAAGVADGFGGEGICYALASGELAGTTVARALAGDGSALDEYEAALDRLIRADHSHANLMGRIARRFPDGAYRVLTSLGEGKAAAIPLLLGEISFGECLRRLPGLVGLGRVESA